MKKSIITGIMVICLSACTTLTHQEKKHALQFESSGNYH